MAMPSGMLIDNMLKRDRNYFIVTGSSPEVFASRKSVGPATKKPAVI